jgi:hypothetical protein
MPPSIRDTAKQRVANLKTGKNMFVTPPVPVAKPLTQSAKSLADRKSQIDQLKSQGDI